MALTLLSGCVSAVASDPTETESTMCRELWREAPTYSAEDTAATLRQGQRFIAVLEAVCPKED